MLTTLLQAGTYTSPDGSYTYGMTNATLDSYCDGRDDGEVGGGSMDGFEFVMPEKEPDT